MKKTISLFTTVVSLFSLISLTMGPTSAAILQEPPPHPAQVAVGRLGRSIDIGLSALDAIRAMDQAAATTAVRQLLNGLVGAASPDFNVEAGDPIGNSDENGIVGYIGQVKAIDPAPSANWVAAAEASEFSINHAVEHTKAAVTAVTATPPDFTTAETEMRLALAFLTGSIGRPNAVTASPGGSLPEGFTHDTRVVEGGLLLLLECAGGDMTTCP